MGFFERLKDGLQKTRKNFTERIECLQKLTMIFLTNWK